MELATTAWTKAYRRQDASPIVGANTDLASMCEACSSPGTQSGWERSLLFRRSLVGVASKGALTPREVAEDPVISGPFWMMSSRVRIGCQIWGHIRAGITGLNANHCTLLWLLAANAGGVHCTSVQTPEYGVTESRSIESPYCGFNLDR